MIPGLGRSPGEGKGHPLQYSGLENSMDSIVHGVAESDMTERLSLTHSLTHSHRKKDQDKEDGEWGRLEGDVGRGIHCGSREYHQLRK